MKIAQTQDEFSREVSKKSECCKEIANVLNDLSPFKNKVFKTFRRPGYKLLLRKDINCSIISLTMTSVSFSISSDTNSHSF